VEFIAETREERAAFVQAIDAAAGEEAPEIDVDAALYAKDAYFEAVAALDEIVRGRLMREHSLFVSTKGSRSLLDLGSLKTVRPPGAVSRRRLDAMYFKDQRRAGERLNYWRCHESDFARPEV
jgi:crotonobetainyl-CoA:carnitine CoA-transferase CaiB-like acyl-CoA transferase